MGNVGQISDFYKRTPPEVVSKIIQEEAKGGMIVEIEKATVKGKLVYEAEIQKDEQEIDIVVSAQGKLLRTEVEDADEEDKDDDMDKDDDADEDDDKDEDKGKGKKD